MTGRIVRSADFERVLGAPTRARSPHFAVHHVAGEPSRPRPPSVVRAAALAAAACELSTEAGPAGTLVVDGSTPKPAQTAAALPAALWLGVVVPKRHARRAVTRNLLKRQIRAAFQRRQANGPALRGGLWVVRLRAPFDRQQYPSAASAALRAAARAELEALLDQAAVRGRS